MSRHDFRSYPPRATVVGTYVHLPGRCSSKPRRHGVGFLLLLFLFFAAEVDAEGPPESAAGVSSSLARFGSLPNWLGAAVSCDPWSAGPIIRRPLGEIHFCLRPAGVLGVLRRDDDVCVAPERRDVSAVWPLFGAVCLAQPVDN